MEKKSESKKEKKVTKTSPQKTTKKSKVEKDEIVNNNEGFISKDTKKLIKFIAMLASFFAVFVAIIVFVFGLISIFSVANSTNNELAHNSFSMSFVSKINNVSFDEMQLNALSLDSKFIFITAFIFFPSLALICISISIIYLSNLLINFFEDVTYENELFNNKKLVKLEEIISVICLIMFTISLLFGELLFIVSFMIFILLFVIHYLFKKCISYEKNK